MLSLILSIIIPWLCPLIWALLARKKDTYSRTAGFLDLLVIFIVIASFPSLFSRWLDGFRLHCPRLEHLRPSGMAHGRTSQTLKTSKLTFVILSLVITFHGVSDELEFGLPVILIDL